jgi:hypothetical protein
MCDSARAKFTTVTGTAGVEVALVVALFARRAVDRFLAARLVGLFDRDFIRALQLLLKLAS